MTRVPVREVPRRRRLERQARPAPSSASLDLTGNLIRAAIASEVEALGGSAADTRRIADLAACALWTGSAATAFGL
ncbi:hypothetical protein MMAD_02560 [Mycolicibacterium madagascariense]|jgi:hypothetical protein|uniref:TetR family transcriptional regulator n=1 Tax=Mycolicibacterium madagascariense TaxID=212765 RepID=A0A7I7XBG5_9MYCO|nr:hypothetical protein [Mycolicibacterium madagascariense]MCV7015044.1 hypothetical protein [Mycolicibacterium madagascariense]BBZ25961.1 hypothetical protein MMAD_02560 [Mycolicibacterium madagascariense]